MLLFKPYKLLLRYNPICIINEYNGINQSSNLFNEERRTVCIVFIMK